MGAGEIVMLEESGCTAVPSAELIAESAEAQLIERLRSGDRLAFEELVAEYHALVYGLAYRLLNDPEEARDVTQETFLKVFRHLSRFRGESGLKTWMYRITVNQAANHQRWWRRRKRESTVSIDSGEQDRTIPNRLADRRTDPEQRAIAQQRERYILRALYQIKRDYQVAVILRDIEELSYEEIAETLQISIGTVKSRIARGREELRKRLKNCL